MSGERNLWLGENITGYLSTYLKGFSTIIAPCFNLASTELLKFSTSFTQLDARTDILAVKQTNVKACLC